jgi:hypothetical protein
MRVIELSSKTGAGMDVWMAALAEGRSRAPAARSLA